MGGSVSTAASTNLPRVATTTGTSQNISPGVILDCPKISDKGHDVFIKEMKGINWKKKKDERKQHLRHKGIVEECMFVMLFSPAQLWNWLPQVVKEH